MRFIALPNGSCRLINKKGRLLPLSALPNPSRIMVIDTIPDGPYDHMDPGFDPVPYWKNHPYMWDRKERNCCMPNDNSWKRHRDTRYRVNKEVV